MPFAVGEMVGPYRIIQQLGQGGMATVYKAYHAALDRYVAIKVLHPAFTEDPNFLARFQREARVVAKLEHPNIVPIYDYAEHEGRPYLVMKFIEGETLKARLARGRVQADEVARIVEAVGAALSYAHKGGILHRDIKPSNVLLGDDGQIYLADFGLARIAQAGESTLTSDMIVGTPQYISPEQAMGKKDLDEGTDIYSLGVMLYELVVGRVPFSADTPFSIIHDHIYSPLPLPTQLNPGVPEDVERVLLKALAKERSDRYADVRALVTAFLDAWADVAAEAPATPLPTVVPPETVVRTSSQPPDQTRPPATVSAPPPPDETPPPAPVSPPPVSAAVPAGGRLRKIPWMWLAVAVLVFLCCIFTFLALRGGNRQARSGQNGTSAPAGETLPAIVTPTVVQFLAEAAERVEQNPDDPYAHLQLAAAYLDAGIPDMATETMTRALEVGGENEQFLWDACRQMEMRQAWLLAARACVSGAEIHQRQVSLDLPGDLQALLYPVLYRAAPAPAFEQFLPMERILLVDEMMANVVQARRQIYANDPQGARQTLEAALQRWPRKVELQLVRAEFLARYGDAGQALQILNEIQATAGLADWILQEAENIRATIP
ncbi:MAG: protein kinase [Anaerolineales bacterium]